MKMKIKTVLLLIIMVMVLAVGCECDTDCYEEAGGMQPDSSKTEYYIEFETD